ncbi:hypothetical protein [Planococcus citreus]|uniref:Uncharacterized protein n=1 Tax=Planococcus citreus TaxID=1373 RepID=A0A497YHC2_9BACL|nr:hypothetical protein [Planococcus citreus]RLJ86619.1 hypothetical protein DFR62_2221 [Planococcus citreus]
MNREEVAKYIQYIALHMQKDYGVDLQTAGKLIKEYKFINMIIETDGQCLHYDAQYWSEKIYHHKYINTMNV